MDAAELYQRFKVCMCYKQAASWRKPFIAPSRFIANQLRKFGLLRYGIGTVLKVNTFHLPAFTVVSGDPVSDQIMSYGTYEDELTEAFLRLVQPNQVVVDIGMHLGYFTTLFAQLVGPGGQVHSFEPTPSTRKLSLANVSQFPQVTVHPLAVWSSRTTMTFYDYGVQWMAYNSFTKARLETEVKGTPFQVETITLDIFCQTLNRPIAVVKIDAESAERDILSGAVGLLASDQPIISLEVGDEGSTECHSRELVEIIQKMGYRVWEFRNGRFLVHALRSNYTYDNLICAPAARDLSSA
jgi:FkbM family methyltransferase